MGNIDELKKNKENGKGAIITTAGLMLAGLLGKMKKNADDKEKREELERKNQMLRDERSRLEGKFGGKLIYSDEIAELNNEIDKNNKKLKNLR